MKTVVIDVPDKYGNIICMSLIGKEGFDTYVTTAAHDITKYTHFEVADDNIVPTDNVCIIKKGGAE